MPGDVGTPRTRAQLALQIASIFGIWVWICRDALGGIRRGDLSVFGSREIAASLMTGAMIAAQCYRYRTQKSAEETFRPLMTGAAFLIWPTIMFGLFAAIFWFSGLRPLIVIPLMGWLYVAARLGWEERRKAR